MYQNKKNIYTAKIIILMLPLIWISILSGCGHKESFDFAFDQFKGQFITDNKFTTHTSKLSGFAFDLLSNNIVKIFTQTESTGFTDSIIITKKKTSQTLDEIISQNFKKINMDGFMYEQQDDGTIKCPNEIVKTITINSSLQGEINQTFFTQIFFIYQNTLYIVSFSSDQESERNNFASDIQKLKCNIQT